MKILHTSDWHLGQKFINNERKHENKEVLNWLLRVIDEEQVDLLIIAGDIFDMMNPPNYARTIYYDFLTKLEQTNCKYTVIVGGNHDSPSTLNAPRELLRTKNIFVVGCVPANLEDEVIVLKDKQGTIEAVVAAVPFLRDSDIRQSIPNELYEDRSRRIREGIKNHYQKLADHIKQYEHLNVPLIATGHLFAAKATDGKQSKIYVGNIENIDVDDFPKLFNYVALGHIHKAQMVNFENHIRYSGSLIPLSFKEIGEGNEKSVYVLDFDGRSFTKKTIKVPTQRQLIKIEGSYEEVIIKLKALEIPQDELQAWLEVTILTDKTIPNLAESLEEMVKGKNVQILQKKLQNSTQISLKKIDVQDLKAMDETEIFDKLLDAHKIKDERREVLQQTYIELLNSMDEQDIE